MNTCQVYHNQTLAEFVEKQTVNHPRRGGFVGLNQMAWDMGLPRGHFDRLSEVQHLVGAEDCK